MNTITHKAGALFVMAMLVIAPFTAHATWFEGLFEGEENETETIIEENHGSCSISASAEEVEFGGVVTIEWEVEGFSTVKINGESVSNETGSFVSEEIVTNTTYTLNASNEGDDTCTATARVEVEEESDSAEEGEVVEEEEEEEEKEEVVEEEEEDVVFGCTDEHAVNFSDEATENDESCEYETEEEPTEEEGEEETTPEEDLKVCILIVEKEVNYEVVDAGSQLQYIVDVQNVGTANCTGGGVRIFDFLDDNFTFVSAEVSENFSTGYGDLPLYSQSEHLVRVNGHTLEPSEWGRVTITGTAAAPESCTDYTITNKAKATAFELNNFQTWVYSDSVTTRVEADAGDCEPEVVPGCTDETALNYNANATEEDGSCEYETTEPAPVCESFTANVSNLPSTGGEVTLTWDTTNATNVTVYPHLGVVAADGSDVAAITASTKFLLTATNADGVETTCDTTVLVDPAPEVFTCSNNVLFTATDTSIDTGDTITLDWTVTDADSVSIDKINATTLTGSQAVSPSDDTTYTLTAVKGNNSIDCTVAVNVSTPSSGGGGGGGGSISPRCELEVSDNSISAGQEITLTWDTRNATAVTLVDDNDEVIFTTDDFLSDDKKKYYDYEVDVKPTTDTTYTLIAERGRRDQECTVRVDVEDNIVVLEARDQQPLVGSISLTEVPYTGFEAGTFASFLFYALLVLWALYITYVFVVRKQGTATATDIAVAPSVMQMQNAQALRPDLFPTMGTTVPANLPTTQKKSLTTSW